MMLGWSRADQSPSLLGQDRPKSATEPGQFHDSGSSPIPCSIPETLARANQMSKMDQSH